MQGVNAQPGEQKALANRTTEKANRVNGDGRQQRQQTAEDDLTSIIRPSTADNGSDVGPLRRHNSLPQATIRRLGDDLTSIILPSSTTDSGSDDSPLRRHNSLPRAIRRPGDYMAYCTLIAMLIRGGVRSLLANVGASKTKCRILLLVSIIFETCATSLSKRARDIESPPLFIAACSLYLLWCVTIYANPLTAFH
jgi:hypothetical protein